jgi:hypothetical protein
MSIIRTVSHDNSFVLTSRNEVAYSKQFPIVLRTVDPTSQLLNVMMVLTAARSVRRQTHAAIKDVVTSSSMA